MKKVLMCGLAVMAVILFCGRLYAAPSLQLTTVVSDRSYIRGEPLRVNIQGGIHGREISLSVNDKCGRAIKEYKKNFVSGNLSFTIDTKDFEPGKYTLLLVSGNEKVTKAIEIILQNIDLPSLNPREGTLAFWFRPDWGNGDFTPHTIIEVNAQPVFTLNFKKGWNATIAPDYPYLTLSPGGTTFGPLSLFSARTWRHYAIRWSAERNIVDVVIDGEPSKRKGSYKTGAQGYVKAVITIGNSTIPGEGGFSCGAYRDIQVFDRYLEPNELMKIAGLSQTARYRAKYLQEQEPPRGGSSDAGKEISYVEVATGKTVTETASGKDESAAFVYNPEKMPDLLVTEHTKWARPLAGGPIRTLIVLPTGFYDEWSSLRDGVELWQRLDMKCDIVDPDTSPAEVMKKDYDVIIVGHQGIRNWGVMNDILRQWILDRVKNGKSGFVMVHRAGSTDDVNAVLNRQSKIPPSDILRGFPLSVMHKIAGDSTNAWLFQYDKVFELTNGFFLTPAEIEDAVQVYKDSSMRAVFLDYKGGYGYASVSGLTPDTGKNSAATDVHYDYWQSFLCRAVLFAAGRTSSGVITSADVANREWQVSTKGSFDSAVLCYRARDVWGKIYAEGEQKIVSGTCALKGTPLPPRAVVDFILKDANRNVLDWYSAAVPPASDAKITGLVLDKASYGIGETVQGTAGIITKDGLSGVLVVYLADHESRRLVKREVPVSIAAGGKESASFYLTIPKSSDSLLMRVEAQLILGDNILDEQNVDCPVPKVSAEGFYAGVPGQSFNNFADRQRRKIFRERYLNNLAMRKGKSNYATFARENMRTFEYSTHLGYDEPGSDMSSPDNWENFFPKNLWCDLEQVKLYRPLFYSLGEEHYTVSRSSQSPTCTVRFRKFAQETYGSLDTLNAAWGTNYVSWDEVSMLSPEIIDMMKIQHASVEFVNRRFMENLFADRHAYLAEYIRKVDPAANVGIHCGWDLSMGRGYDYWLLSRGMESMIGYAGPQAQYIRSFFRNCYGIWYHYAIGNQDDVRWGPWSMLISGARGFNWFTINAMEWGAFTSDLHLSSDWKASCDDYRAAKETGDLLSRTRYSDDQVAIHYSQDSFQAGVPNMTWIHQSFINLLYDAGVPFKFVSYEQVAKNELIEKKFPMFILPHSISLSGAEENAIRSYVERGGVLWADVIPGEYDNFGRKLPQSRLADLFSGMKEEILPGGLLAKSKVVGKGLVILADIGNYNYDRNVGNHLPAQEFLSSVATKAGIKKVCTIKNVSNETIANGVWSAGYRCGRQYYIVAARDYQLADSSPLNVTIDIPEKGYVYEMPSGRCHEMTDCVTTELITSKGKVFSVLPYRINQIQPVLINQAQRGKNLELQVQFLATGEIRKDEIHLVRVTVTGPDKKEIVPLRRLLEIYGGKGTVLLPLAYNDPLGKYEIQLKDTATGISAVIPVVLQQKGE